MSYEIKIPKSILKSFKIDRESSTEDVLVLRTAAINTDQEAFAFVKKFGNLIGTKYILNFTNPNPTRIVYHTNWVCKYSKRNKAPHSKTNLNCEASISYKIKKNYFRSKYRDAFLGEQPPKPGILKISLKHTHPLNPTENTDYILWSEEIAKPTEISADITSEHEGDDNENIKKESSSLPFIKRKAYHPLTRLGRPPQKVQKVKEILKKEILNPLTREKKKVYVTKSEIDKKASNNHVDNNSEKQTNTSENLKIQAIEPAAATIKIEKDAFITPDYPTISEKENQSAISTRCSIEIKKEKLTDTTLSDPASSKKERQLVIVSDDSVASESESQTLIPSEKLIENENDVQIIIPPNDPIISGPKLNTVPHSNDQASSENEKPIRPATSPTANASQIITTASNAVESQTKEQTISVSNYFQPVIDTTTSLQNTHISQTSEEKQKVNIFFLQVKPDSPLFKPGVEVKDLAFLPGGIPPPLPSNTNAINSKAQTLTKTPRLKGSLVSNGMNSPPLLILQPLDSNTNLSTSSTASASTNSFVTTSLVQPYYKEQLKQGFFTPATGTTLQKSSNAPTVYIKEEPIDIIDEEYELSDDAMKNSFVTLGQLENLAKDQPLKAKKRDLGEEINRCYNHAEKLFKKLRTERLTIEDNSSADSSPNITSEQSHKRKKRQAESEDSDSNRKQEEDKIDSYCNQVAMRLKLLDSKTCSFVQNAIDNLLCDAEVGVGEFFLEKKSGERSLRDCVTPTFLSAYDECTSPFSSGSTLTSWDSESTLTAFSDSNISS